MEQKPQKIQYPFQPIKPRRDEKTIASGANCVNNFPLTNSQLAARSPLKNRPYMLLSAIAVRQRGRYGRFERGSPATCLVLRPSLWGRGQSLRRKTLFMCKVMNSAETFAHRGKDGVTVLNPESGHRKKGRQDARRPTDDAEHVVTLLLILHQTYKKMGFHWVTSTSTS